MQHVMLDLETMGKGPAAAIVAIGAVEFDPYASTVGGSFYTVVDLDSSIKGGGVVDASTVLWWLQQGEQARRELTSHSKDTLGGALYCFAVWCEARQIENVWGNGAAFDNVILGTAYDRAGIPRPWPFWGDMCYRTMKTLHPEVPFVRMGTHHNALDDAMSQANHLIEIFKRIGGSK